MSDIKYPSSSSKDSEEKALGRWFNVQRHAYNEGYLSKARIKKLEQLPGWSWSPVSERTDENKKKLLEMARNGDPRPNKKRSQLGMTLCSYTCTSASSYDAEFDKKIRRLAPHWFTNTADEKKKQLLEMARIGEPKPHRQTSPLADMLRKYTQKNTCYDAEFDKKIRKLAPHWFINTADENKKKLLEMARNGEPRPNSSTTLGSSLCSYTNQDNGSYDADFDRSIRKLALHWFFNAADENKKKLLEMARKKKDRPHWKSKLAQRLCQYTNQTKIYDPKFDKEIRAIAPHWFNTADGKKEQLLEMARKGKPKSDCRTELKNALNNYTREGSSSYDPQFDKKIKQLAVRWFRSQARAPQGRSAATKQRQSRVA